MGWLVLAGIVLAVILGKRRYQNKFASAVEAAAEGGRAEVRAQLGQHVNVEVNASHNGGAGVHECVDPFACAVCSPVLFRVLSAYRDVGAVGIAGSSWSHHDDEHDDDDRRADDYGGVDRGGRGVTGELVGDDCRSAARSGGARDRDGVAGSVEGVPGPYRLAPGTVNDMIARPWAYDEADPRFERGVPVGPGRGGRGPGR